MQEKAYQHHEQQSDLLAVKNDGSEKEHVVQGVDMSDFCEAHVESAAVKAAYARKVYIFNKIINENIGMTPWHYGLLMVAGLGWFLDNAWLQLVALIQAQITVEYYGDQYVKDHPYTSNPAWLTCALFTGLLIGATFWGYAADVVGRRLSFNVTLFICGVFGVAAGGARNFASLAGLIGASCFGIGGSMPVDGMIFLEFLPGNRQFLLTLLSVFWSLGQLVTSLIGWGFIAHWHCDTHDECVNNTTSAGWLTDNVGWRYMIFTTGAYTLFAFFVRFFLFRIPESPKFYLSNGRDAEAIRALYTFANMCGKPLPEGYLTVASLHAAANETESSNPEALIEAPSGVLSYFRAWMLDIKHNLLHSEVKSPFTQLKPLFSTLALGYTTSLTWILWLLIGLAYPLFNSFIITYLNDGQSGGGSGFSNKTYRNYVIVSVCGVPGSLIGAWMVTWPRSGRRGAMAIGTLLSGVFLFGFTGVGSDPVSQLAFSSIVNFMENIMYGVLYCYTPESFPAPLRGTAGGIAAMLNRAMGVVAAIIKVYTTGDTSSTTAQAPIYTSAALFILSALLMLTLRVETAARTSI